MKDPDQVFYTRHLDVTHQSHRVFLAQLVPNLSKSSKTETSEDSLLHRQHPQLAILSSIGDIQWRFGDIDLIGGWGYLCIDYRKEEKILDSQLRKRGFSQSAPEYSLIEKTN